MDIVKPGIYQHYKGKKYQVIGEASHSETLEQMVVYRALYGAFGLWVRPKAMFLETVTVDGAAVPRFRYISTSIAAGKEKGQPLPSTYET